MRITILLPHFQNGKISAYAISQLLKYKGKHEIEIFVIDNGAGDGSIEYLKPFVKDIKYQAYPKDMLQSHGVAFDFILPHVTSEFFITIESDSFPTEDNWLDSYEHLINNGFDTGGSMLQLSGGKYLHPAGSFYRHSIWREAKQYCNGVEYAYFPNMCLKEGFECHTMVHKSVVEDVMKNIYDYIEPSKFYKNATRQQMVTRLAEYSPVVAPFHNGMGMSDESIKTFHLRNPESEAPTIILNNKKKIIRRIGEEPGQWFSYYHYATNKKVFEIPTEVKWMEGKENRQQEYSIMENGFKHIWAGSAYLSMKDTDQHDVYEFKKNQIDELYDSLPEHQKIKL